jgi:hypothetical protein
MELGVGGGDAGHLELVLRSEQGSGGERRPTGVGHDRSALLQADRRRGQVVRGVVEYRPAPDPLEFRPHRGDVVDDPRPGLDVGVELPRGDPGHVEGG